MTKSVRELDDQLGIKVGRGNIVQRDQGSMGKHDDKAQWNNRKRNRGIGAL